MCVKGGCPEAIMRVKPYGHYPSTHTITLKLPEEKYYINIIFYHNIINSYENDHYLFKKTLIRYNYKKRKKY